MSETKVFKTRIQSKRATTAEWDALVDFIPLFGEIIIYGDEGQAPKFKVGDGVTLLSSLPFSGGIGEGDITIDLEDAEQGQPALTNADMLGGVPAEEYARKDEVSSAAVRIDFDVILSAENWSEEAPYVQEVEIDHMGENDRPIFGQNLEDATVDTIEELEENYSYITYANAGVNKITFTCLQNKPAIDLNIFGYAVHGGDSNYDSAVGVEF